MAKLVVTNAAPDFMWWPSALENDGPGDIVSSSSTSLRFLSNTGYVVILSGSGFDIAGDTATGGTVKSVTVRDSADTTTLMSITGLEVKLPKLFDVLFGKDGGSGPAPFAALNLLMEDEDTLTGSSGSDQIGAWSPGNDRVDAKSGHDSVAGDPGNDKLDGGTGFDVLSYYHSIHDTTSFRGIKLDAAKGTVTDAWGGKDTFKNFETYEGSEHSDVMKGSKTTEFIEEFRGLSGADTIDGRDGFDRVIHTHDAFYGGAGGGISANLDTGTIIDGWGHRDKVKNVESVFGTAFNDTFVGDNNVNEFQGPAGVDSYVGRGASDWVSFWFNNFNGGLNGVEVNLSLGAGQVIDDGYGNTETARLIENMEGTLFGDSFIGNRSGNAFYGWGGNDTLAGGKGFDYLDGGAGDDTITGGPGNDRLMGRSGVDTLTYADANSEVTVNLFRERASGGGGNDKISGFENITGSKYDDSLTGSRGGSTINGGPGDDVLVGSDVYSAIDKFVFDDPAFSVDNIKHFTVDSDLIQLDTEVFSALPLGVLEYGSLVEGPVASNATDRIIYDPATGNLYYDPDGVGGVGQRQFANLNGVATGELWHDAFEVIA